MAAGMRESTTLSASEGDTFKHTNSNVSPVDILEEGVDMLPVTKQISSLNKVNDKARQSNAAEDFGQIMMERSGTKEAGVKFPVTIENIADVKYEKEETMMRHITLEKNTYERAMCYLHQHSLPSLFQYMTINLAYQRPEDAIGFMIDEVSKETKNKTNK